MTHPDELAFYKKANERLANIENYMKAMSGSLDLIAAAEISFNTHLEAIAQRLGDLVAMYQGNK